MFVPAKGESEERGNSEESEMPRPEFQAPPDVFYNESEARKYTTSSRIIEIQVSKRSASPSLI